MTDENTEVTASLDNISFEAEVPEDDTQLTEAPEGQAESVDTPEETPEVSPLELPEFWPKANREHIEKLQSLEGGREYAEQWLNQWQENQEFIKKQQSEAETYRGQANELQEYQRALQPLNQIWQSQAIRPAMGLAQLAHYGQMLHTDPKGLINEIAQRSGLDLTQLVEEQPYIDPHVQSELRTLQQQNQQFQQYIGQTQQAQQEAQRRGLQEQIDNFASATDASGNLTNPYFEQAKPIMQKLLMTGQADSLESAYEQAVGLSSDIQAEIKAANEKIEAERKHKEAQKAAESDTRVNPKSKDTPKAKRTLDNMFDDILTT